MAGHSIDQEYAGRRFGQVENNPAMLENLFNQSPIQGGPNQVSKKNNNLLTSLDEIMKETVLRSNYNSNQKEEEELDEDLSRDINQDNAFIHNQINDFALDSKRGKI
jgi:hypothetical protein